MLTITLPETESQIKTLNTERLLTILESLPANEHALTLGIAVRLAARFDAERKKGVRTKHGLAL